MRTLVPNHAAAWALAPGQALTLRPRQSGCLALRRGSAWITRDGPHGGHVSAPAGDLWLPAGASLAVRAGERLVLEPIRAPGASAPGVTAACFEWRPRPDATSWQAAVAAPAGELRAALGAAARALARLLRGLWIWGARRQPV